MFSQDQILIRQLLLTIDRVLEYSINLNSPDDLAIDYKTFDAILMNFVALGETVGKLSNDIKEKQRNIDWRKIYAFRNIVAHDYFGVDEEVVWQIIQKHLPKLKSDLQSIINQ
ncbi:MAG: DUF86 domain-containing protein [Candidatus Kapabacteria bacterium]|nr:DUF86 domain-containing protein [Ignavibacteriota bacterium]MCW5884096.1 DUF86 domain-containing protein [Candidatus Kapabacteria bacterium]